ncbi:hypothetical protein D3C76_1215880 [compost metagenome]
MAPSCAVPVLPVVAAIEPVCAPVARPNACRGPCVASAPSSVMAMAAPVELERTNFPSAFEAVTVLGAPALILVITLSRVSVASKTIAVPPVMVSVPAPSAPKVFSTVLKPVADGTVAPVPIAPALPVTSALSLLVEALTAASL